MSLIVFTKMFQDQTPEGLVRTAKSAGIDGLDLCVRSGYPVNPDNVHRELPALVRRLADHGLIVPLVTGEGIWEGPDHPASERMMAALAQAGVTQYKLGYAFYQPDTDGGYWESVDAFREQLAGWARLAERYGVKVCYHTHCDVPGLELGYYLGANCSALMHLIQDFDPQHVGAYIGTANLLISGEPFKYGLSMIREYLSTVELQDVYYHRESDGDEGYHKRFWTSAGDGAVSWSEVFRALHSVGFDGPLTMHAEFEVPPGQSFDDMLIKEAAYFRNKLDSAALSVSTPGIAPSEKIL